MTTPGIGIVGSGGIGRNHSAACRARGFRVVAGDDADPGVIAKVREAYAGVRLSGGLAEHLAVPGMDVVDLAIPHDLEARRPIVRDVARAGKARFCRKPLAETLAVEGEWFNDAFGESMLAFLAQAAGGPPHPSAGRADLAVMAVVEAAYRSAAEGRAVEPARVLAEAEARTIERGNESGAGGD